MLSYNSKKICFPSSHTVLLVCEYRQNATSSFKSQGSLSSKDASALVFVSRIHSKVEYYNPSRQIYVLNTDNPPTISEH